MHEQLPLVILSGRGHPALADRICDYLQISPARVKLFSFSDGEILVEIDENVRGGDVFVVQSICTPGNDNLMELCSCSTP
jgi:ribose-phosphate pyrophosphokinase